MGWNNPGFPIREPVSVLVPLIESTIICSWRDCVFASKNRLDYVVSCILISSAVNMEHALANGVLRCWHSVLSKTCSILFYPLGSIIGFVGTSRLQNLMQHYHFSRRAAAQACQWDIQTMTFDAWARVWCVENAASWVIPCQGPSAPQPCGRIYL